MANYFDKYDAPTQAPAPAASPAGNWGDPNHLLRLADALQRAGRTGEANQVFKRVMELQGGGSDVTYSMTPQFGTDGQGNPVMLQLGNNGTVKQSALPAGVSLSRQPIEVDGGTHTILIDPITRQEISRVEKNVREAAAEQAGGTIQGQTAANREVAAPGQVQAANNSLDLLGKIRNDPNMAYGTGMWSYLNGIRGTDAYDFNNIVEQAKGGAFLTAIEQLRGMGALSNTEGQAATSAVNRMNVATSQEAFVDALNDYEKIVMQGRDKAQAIIDGGAIPIAEPAGADQPSQASASQSVNAGAPQGLLAAPQQPAVQPDAVAPRGLLGGGSQQYEGGVPVGAGTPDPAPAVTNDVPIIRTRAEYDALPKGTAYKKPGWATAREKQ